MTRKSNLFFNLLYLITIFTYDLHKPFRMMQSKYLFETLQAGLFSMKINSNKVTFSMRTKNNNNNNKNENFSTLVKCFGCFNILEQFFGSKIVILLM